MPADYRHRTHGDHEHHCSDEQQPLGPEPKDRADASGDLGTRVWIKDGSRHRADATLDDLARKGLSFDHVQPLDV